MQSNFEGSSDRPSERLQAINTLLGEEHYGVLATTSHQYAGFPFASLCQFAVESSGNLLILVSGLAEHAKNLRADPKASLYIQQASEEGDPQDSARVCVLVRVFPVERDEMEAAADTYLSRFPGATMQLSLGDFYFLRLVPEHIRMIQGFGSMFWMHAPEYRSGCVDDDPTAG